MLDGRGVLTKVMARIKGMNDNFLNQSGGSRWFLGSCPRTHNIFAKLQHSFTRAVVSTWCTLGMNGCASSSV